MHTQLTEEIINLASVYYKKGSYKQAADMYSQAVLSYNSKKMFILSAEMKNNQSVALLLAKQPHDALAACANTAEFFLEAKDKKRAGIAYANEAAAFEALKKYSLAEENYQNAADIFKSIGEKEMYAQIFQSLSQVQIRMGKQFEALSSMKINLENTQNKSLQQKVLKFVLKIQKTLVR